MKTVAFRNDTILILSDTAIEKLRSFVQIKKHKNESGGVLFGKKISKKEEYILTDISEPTKQDKGSRYSFLRNKDSAQRIINKKWKETRGEENYIGEWHTHPEPNPKPSKTDLDLMLQVVLDKSCAFSKIFLIIVGTDSSLYIRILSVKDKLAESITVL